MKMTTSLACALFAFACTAAAGAQDGGTNASARNAVNGGKVVLLPFGRPGPGGSAALAQQGANVVVTLTLPNMQGTVMAALLQGSCTTGAPQVNNVGQALK